MRRSCIGLLVGLSGCSLYFDGPEPRPDDPPNVDLPPEQDPSPALVDQLAVDEPGTYAMETDATHVYWVDNGQFDHQANLRRMPRGGGPIETILTVSERVYDFALGEGYAFVAYTGPGHAGEILRVPAAGGPANVIATGFNPTAISVDGGWVYYNAAISPGGAISRVPTAGGTPELVVDDVDNPWDLVAMDGVVYYSEMNRADDARRPRRGPNDPRS